MNRKVPLLLTLFVLWGCVGLSEAPEGVQEARQGVAAIVAHTESAEANVQRAMPLVKPAGKPYLEMASSEHGETLIAATDTGVALNKAETDAARIARELKDLRAKWYVRWGIKINRWFWSITIGWFIFCAVAIAAQLGNPLTITVRIIKFVVGLIPFTYIASLIGKMARQKRDGA